MNRKVKLCSAAAEIVSAVEARNAAPLNKPSRVLAVNSHEPDQLLIAEAAIRPRRRR